MYATRQTSVGVDLVSWNPGFQIAGIEVNNPSGSWLLLSGINQYIPPYRAGWKFSLSPAQAAIDLSFVDSPSGSLSVLAGPDVVVTLYDEQIGTSEGVTTGAGSKVSTIPPLLHAIAPSIGTGAASTLISMLANPTQKIVVRRLEIVPDLTAGLASQQPFRSIVTVRFEQSGGGVGTPQWHLAISPESPFSEASFEDGAFVLDAGTDLDITGFAEQGSAKAYYIAMAQYYLENE